MKPSPTMPTFSIDVTPWESNCRPLTLISAQHDCHGKRLHAIKLDFKRDDARKAASD
jgi:hypothetical protein